MNTKLNQAFFEQNQLDTNIGNLKQEPGVARARSILELSSITDADTKSENFKFEDLSISPPGLITLFNQLNFELYQRPDILPVNLSDFDGTLTSGISGSKIFEYAAKTNFFLPVVRDKLDEVLNLFLLGADPEGSIGKDFLNILKEFRGISNQSQYTKEEKEIITQKVYQMLSWIYAGHTKSEVEDFAIRAFAEIGYEGFHFEGAKEIVSTLRDNGIETLLVSVKFQPILEVAARFFEIAKGNIAGMKLKIDPQGIYTDEIEEPMTFREGKLQAANALLEPYRKNKLDTAKPLFAMGDSPAKSDQQMLEMSVISIVAEPQTANDAEYARLLAKNSKPIIILDYEKTRSGTAVTNFDRHLEEQQSPAGKFL